MEVDISESSDNFGEYSDYIAISHLKKIFGANTIWKKVNKNDSNLIVGYYYDEDAKKIIEPQPYPSWSYNSSVDEWIPPTEKPESLNFPEEIYIWDEESYLNDNTGWVLVRKQDFVE